MLEQFEQQHAPLPNRLFNDMRGMHPDPQDFALRSRVRANEGPLHRRHLRKLRLGRLVAQPDARVQRRVDAVQVGDGVLQVFWQRVVSRAQVGVFGLPAHGGHHDRVEHRVFRRRALERAVAVPKLVGQVRDRLAIRRGMQAAVYPDIGNVDRLLVPEAARRAGVEFLQAAVQRAEAARERDLLLLGERLAAKHDHGVRVHRIVDGAHCGRVDRLR